jgi:outer membrane protein assembly factor BamB
MPSVSCNHRFLACASCVALLLTCCGKKGGAPLSGKSVSGRVKWQYKSTGSAVSHPAVGSDGTIYVGTSRGLQAVSPDGNSLWMATLNQAGVPVVSGDGTIYLDIQHGLMFGVSQDGQLVWRPQFGLTGFGAPPALGPGPTLYFLNTTADTFPLVPNSSEERLWSLASLPPGMQVPRIRLPWTGGTDLLLRHTAPVLTRNGSVLVPYHNVLRSISAHGSLEWESQLTSGTLGQPALANDGSIYVGDDQGVLFAAEPSGSVKWRFEAGVTGTPVIDTEGVIYFTDGNAVYAVNPDGALKWKSSPQPNVRFLTSPALAADGTLYVGGEFALVAFRPDGALKWNLHVYTPTSSPTIAPDGTIYFACGYSALCAVEDAGSPLMPSAWPKQFHDLANSSNSMHIDN